MHEGELEKKLQLLDQLQANCTHCGLCSEGCATFQVTGWEHESPRGRLQLAARFLHGKIALKSETLSTFDHCLGCQACVSLCPQRVDYRQVRQIVQEIRRDLQLQPSHRMTSDCYRQWIKLVYRISDRRWRHYGAKWLTIPFLTYRSTGSFAKASKRLQMDQPVLAICCVQDLFQHEMIEQTLLLMERLGVTLHIDRKQPCCGAIFERLVHGGAETVCYAKQQKKVAHLQLKARQAFLKWMPPQLYFLARGCQSFISQNPSHDLYAWIEAILESKNITLYFPNPRIVYYQPYCCSQKGEEDSIWRLMRRIRGLTVRDIAYPQACCGGYCGETLLHPENAQAMARQKIEDLPSHATVVVTSPDCWGHFHHYSSAQLTICYPVQVLLEAHVLIHSEQSH